jgi:N-acetylmuramoyl-L-alanine amidase
LPIAVPCLEINIGKIVKRAGQLVFIKSCAYSIGETEFDHHVPKEEDMKKIYPDRRKIGESAVPPKSRGKRLNKTKFVRSVILAACIVAGIFLAVHFWGCPAAQPDENVSGAPSDFVEAESPLLGKKILLDAGHGGFDVGAIGVSGAYEDDMNLAVTLFLCEDLEAAGADVIMTREDGGALAESKDEDMQKRRTMIQNSGSDIVVSIHMNTAENPEVSGPLVLFMPGSVQGEELAKAIQASLIERLAPKSENCARSEDLYILESGAQPCVIVECGFISNAAEEQMLLSGTYQQKVAQAIADGCANYFGSSENP